jgi:fatty-acyl-CoA synthase
VASQLLSSWLGNLSQRWGDRTALELASLSVSGERLSFRELDSQSEALARSFRDMGLQLGDGLAIWLPNGPLWMVAHFAAARAGLTTIPLNTWYRESEIEHFLILGNASTLILDSSFQGIDFASMLRAATSSGSCPLRLVIDTAEQLGDIPNIRVLKFEQPEAGATASIHRPTENDAMIAFSTSGTTGMPKMAVHGEGPLISHAAAVAARAEMSPNDVVLSALPPCGAYGYTLLLASLASGARAVQLDRFDLDHAVRVIQQEEVSVMALTEPIMRSLLDHPSATSSSFRSLRQVFSAGSTLQPVVQRAETDFGFNLTNVYGSSEVLALAAFWNRKDDFETRSGAGGELVSDGMQVSVVDPAGTPCAPGLPGELRFRGPVLTSGYLRNSDATCSAFSEDGWFRSNDLGVLVEGQPRQFRFIARMNDALRVKGFLVDPGEIEARLQAHAAVDAAQVVGVPDGRGEDRAIAFVTLHDGAEASGEELRAFCRSQMASYKVPAAIKIVDTFPTTRSANGDKIVKNRLREMAEELMSDA